MRISAAFIWLGPGLMNPAGSGSPTKPRLDCLSSGLDEPFCFLPAPQEKVCGVFASPSPSHRIRPIRYSSPIQTRSPSQEGSHSRPGNASGPWEILRANSPNIPPLFLFEVAPFFCEARYAIKKATVFMLIDGFCFARSQLGTSQSCKWSCQSQACRVEKKEIGEEKNKRKSL